MTEKDILEKFLDIDLSGLTAQQKVAFLKELNKKLENDIDNLDNNLKQFMLSCAQETVNKLGYHKLIVTNTITELDQLLPA